MKERDVQVGRVYAVKVSERIAPVRLEALYPPSYGTRGGRYRYRATNIKTGRSISVTAAKCRYELESYDRTLQDGRTVRAWRPVS